MKSKLYQLVKQEIEQLLKETGESRLSVHPFANDLANQPDTAPQEDMYSELVKAVMMEMMAVYDEDSIRDIIRTLTQRISQGPTGLGGRFTDEQIEEILMLVFEEVEEKIGIKLGSYLPQDRQHPKYMEME